MDATNYIQFNKSCEATAREIERLSDMMLRSKILPIVRGEPKQHRNDKCKCGSNKKYKTCCINK